MSLKEWTELICGGTVHFDQKSGSTLVMNPYNTCIYKAVWKPHHCFKAVQKFPKLKWTEQRIIIQVKKGNKQNKQTNKKQWFNRTRYLLVIGFLFQSPTKLHYMPFFDTYTCVYQAENLHLFSKCKRFSIKPVIWPISHYWYVNILVFVCLAYGLITGENTKDKKKTRIKSNTFQKKNINHIWYVT